MRGAAYKARREVLKEWGAGVSCDMGFWGQARRPSWKPHSLMVTAGAHWDVALVSGALWGEESKAGCTGCLLPVGTH